MKRHISTPVLAIALVTALCACAPVPRVRAMWYYQEDVKGLPGTFLTLVNEGAPLRKIDHVTMNGSDGDALHLACGLKEGALFDLDKGRIFVCKIEESSYCHVPIEIELKTSTKAIAKVQVAGSMPTSLPEDWIHCCASPELDQNCFNEKKSPASK